MFDSFPPKRLRCRFSVFINLCSYTLNMYLMRLDSITMVQSSSLKRNPQRKNTIRSSHSKIIIRWNCLTSCQHLHFLVHLKKNIVRKESLQDHWSRHQTGKAIPNRSAFFFLLWSNEDTRIRRRFINSYAKIVSIRDVRSLQYEPMYLL